MSPQYSNRKEDITRTIAEASHKILSKHRHWKQRFWISSPRQKFFQKLSFQWPEMPLRGYGGPEHIQKALFQEIPMYICTGPQCLIQTLFCHWFDIFDWFWMPAEEPAGGRRQRNTGRWRPCRRLRTTDRCRQAHLWKRNWNRNQCCPELRPEPVLAGPLTEGPEPVLVRLPTENHRSWLARPPRLELGCWAD